MTMKTVYITMKITRETILLLAYIAHASLTKLSVIVVTHQRL